MFEDLEVYGKAVDLVESVHRTTTAATPGQGYGHIVSQLRRAASSVPLNIAEGFGRYERGDKRRFYQIARASSYECHAALEVCQRCGVIDGDACVLMKEQIGEIGRMITGLIQAIERRGQARDLENPQP
jgi:four helix bundle protein